jgi:hypothetical protein
LRTDAVFSLDPGTSEIATAVRRSMGSSAPQADGTAKRAGSHARDATCDPTLVPHYTEAVSPLTTSVTQSGDTLSKTAKKMPQI